MIGGPFDKLLLSGQSKSFYFNNSEYRLTGKPTSTLLPLCDAIAVPLRLAGIRVENETGVMVLENECYVCERYSNSGYVEWRWVDSDELRFAVAQVLASWKT